VDVRNLFGNFGSAMKQKMTLEIDEKLLAEAMNLSGITTTENTIEMALLALVAEQKRQNMNAVFGRVKWEANLKKMRRTRS